MTESEFQTDAGRLIAQFGKGAYSPERLLILWREVKEMEATWWRRVVDKFLGEHRQAPLLPEIREEIYRERNRTHDLKKDYAPVINVNESHICTQCHNTGSVHVRLRNNLMYSCIFKCVCAAGVNDRRAWPIWTEAHLNKYIPD